MIFIEKTLQLNSFVLHWLQSKKVMVTYHER
jgi:hypothetical protein